MILLVQLASLIGLSLSQIQFAHLQKDELACTTPYNQPGRCIGLRQCRNILELLRRPIPQDVLWYVRRSVCKFEGFLPDVCCPENKIIIGQQIDTTTTTTTTPITTTTPELLPAWGAWSPR